MILSDIFLLDGLILSFPQFLFGSFPVSQQPNILRLKINISLMTLCTFVVCLWEGREDKDWTEVVVSLGRENAGQATEQWKQ